MMNRPSKRPGARSHRGFTLAEVAVTIAIVGLALAWMLQTLSSSKMTAAYSRNLKLARELSIYTLGQIESGLYAEELDQDRIEGSYADEGYPDFYFEAVIGDESLSPNRDDAQAFDNWRHEQQVKRRNSTRAEEEETEQPYEKVQVRVTFPKIADLRNEFVVERWLPWKQVHPDEEETEGAKTGTGAGSSGGSGAR